MKDSKKDGVQKVIPLRQHQQEDGSCVEFLR